MSAARVLRIVGSGRHTAAALRASYQSTASGGLLPSSALLRAEQWLIEQGWLTREGATVIASARSGALLTENEPEVARDLLRATILDWAPAWLSAATAHGEVRPEFLPVEVERVLAEMFDDQERDATLLAAAAKYDDAALRALGEAGEEAVLAACQAFLQEQGRPDLAFMPRRVSLISDALGYDIWSPDLTEQGCRLEVKCYRGRDPTVYITRNEFEVGMRLSRWYLVLCRSVGISPPEVIGWTTLSPLLQRMPRDVARTGRWQVAKVRIDEPELRPGLPLSPSDVGSA